jgi:hypothetical protein
MNLTPVEKAAWRHGFIFGVLIGIAVVVIALVYLVW